MSGASESGAQPPVRARVGIVGAGIGGAALALFLQHSEVPFECVVYEKDSCFEQRRQGYGLTIQQASAALGTVPGLMADVGRVDTPSGTHYKLSSNGTILGCFGSMLYGGDSVVSDPEDKRFNLHIPRQLLRKMLHDRLAPGTVRWGKQLEAFHECDGGVDLSFADGGADRVDVLVGADGIFSKVRQLWCRAYEEGGAPCPLSDPLRFLDTVVVLGVSTHTHPFTEKRIFQTVDGHTRLYAMPFTPTETMWQLSFPFEGGHAAARAFCAADQAEVKKTVVGLCEGWHAPVPDLLRTTDPALIMACPVLDREPPGLKTLPRNERVGRRTTLLGDAVHPMSPFKGQGANVALVDAAKLTRCLEHKNFVLEKALLRFEEEMLARSKGKVLGSRKVCYDYHHPSAVAVDCCRGMPKALADALRERGITPAIFEESTAAEAAPPADVLDVAVLGVIKECWDKGLVHKPPRPPSAVVDHLGWEPLATPSASPTSDDTATGA